MVVVIREAEVLGERGDRYGRSLLYTLTPHTEAQTSLQDEVQEDQVSSPPNNEATAQTSFLSTPSVTSPSNNSNSKHTLKVVKAITKI